MHLGEEHSPKPGPDPDQSPPSPLGDRAYGIEWKHLSSTEEKDKWKAILHNGRDQKVLYTGVVLRRNQKYMLLLNRTTMPYGDGYYLQFVQQTAKQTTNPISIATGNFTYQFKSGKYNVH